MPIVTRAMKVQNHTSSAPAELEQTLNKLEGPSSKIRYLTSLGWERGAIAHKLSIRYQHVRNVQMNPLKKTK